MVKRKERRREIERLFVLRAREGLSLRELADRSGIPVGTLSWWSHRLREEARASESRTESMPAFSQVRLVGPVAAPVEFANEVGSAVRVRLPGGAVVELEGEHAERMVSAVLE